MKPKLIIFDWDGTLADTTNPIIHTFQQSFADCGLPVPEADQIRPLIGYSLSGIIRRLAHNVSEHVQETLIETYAAHYLNPNNHNMTLFPEALPCLQRLKQQGYWLAVATGKGRSGLDKAIAQTDTQAFWLETACASEYPSKPAPDMVLALCDTAHDLEMAANAKIRAIAVATGAHTAQQLSSMPHVAILNSLAELPDVLETL